ncbi:phosphotransferase family protein [Gordonia sp. (in: high G+C Gram-positive bacteria)]|uniref:phosphotransferase family protein n=1 Tax=Gordonia sp. (in: high G+C Gram-positive bacteria) TaxID=84139 RepID=UPI003C712507
MAERPDAAATPGIAADAAAGWLSTLGHDVAGTPTLTRIGLGQSNLTYLAVDERGRRWVLRRPPLGHLLASAHDIGREARILASLADTDVPVPQIYGVADEMTRVGSAAVTDAPLVAMEYIDGLAVDRRSVAEDLSPAHRRAIGMSMPAVLARIHAVDLESVGLADLASRSPYAERQLRRWARQWEQAKTRELPAFDALTRRLEAAVPEQTETTLVHGDFNLSNVLVARTLGDGGRAACGEVVAALDWELSTLGEPLADMGSLLAYWPEPGEGLGGELTASTLDGFPRRDELAAEYLRLTGRDERALRYWQVLGLWKLASIAEGVMRRALDEPRNRAAAGTPTAERIDAIVETATRIADDAGL